MASLLFALVATFVTGFGGRDQLIVARLSDALGPSRALLAVALACAAISAGVMGWAGWQVELRWRVQVLASGARLLHSDVPQHVVHVAF